MANVVGGSVVWNLDVETGKLDSGLSSAAKSVKSAAGKINDSLNKTTESIDKTIKSLGKGLKGMGKELSVSVTAPISALAGSAVLFARLGGQYSSVQDAFRSMTKDMGINAEEFQKRVSDATGGQIDNLTILQSATRGLALIGKDAFNDFGDDFTKMAELSKKAARATGQDVDFLFESLVLGIARESKLILDNLGVSIDITNAKEEYAKSLGKEVKALTASEEKHAVMTRTLSQLEDTYGGVRVSAGGFSGAWQELTTSLTNARIEIGRELEPAMADLADTVTVFVKDLLPKIIDLLRIATDWFSNLSPEAKNALLIFTGALAALGPLVFTIGTILSAGPVSILVASLAGITALVVTFLGEWEEFKNQLKLVADKYGPLVSRKINNIKDSIDDFRASIGDVIENIVEFGDNVKNTFEKKIDVALTNSKNSFKNFTREWLGDFDRWDTDLTSGMTITLATLHDKIWNTLFQIGSDLNSSLDAWIQSIFNWAVHAYDAFIKWKDDTLNAFEAWKTEMGVKIGLWAIDALETITKWSINAPVELGKFIDKSLDEMVKWGDSMITVVVVAFDNLGRSIKTWWDNLGKAKEPSDTGEKMVKDTVGGMWKEANKLETLLLVGKIIVGIIVGGIALMAISIVAIGLDIIKLILRGMWSAVTWAFNEMAKIVKDISEAVMSVDWVDLGKRAITGIADGIKNSAKNALSGAVSTARGVLSRLEPEHRESPSLLDNIRSGIKKINSAYAGINIPDYSPSIGGFSAGVDGYEGGRTVNINNQITMQRPSDVDAFSRRLSFEAQTI